MDAHEQLKSIRIGAGPNGSLTYLVDLPPEDLPPVGKRALEHAWHAARQAALAQQWGEVRGFRFNRPDGSHTDLALIDRDARCWAAAVDRLVGLGASRGLSLCLRLLALVDLLARAHWARPLFKLARDGVEFHPALLRTAASVRLTPDARFDETGFRMRLSQFATGFQLEPAQPVRRLDAPMVRPQESSNMSRLVLPLVFSTLALAACARAPAPAAQSDAAARAECRQRADEVYTRQNRAAIYSPSAPVNAPFSANYQPGTTDRGLSQLFAHENMIRDCVRGAATGPAPSTPGPSAPGPSAPGPSAPGPSGGTSAR